MNMAKSAAKLFSENLKYSNGSVEASATVAGGTLEWNGMQAEIPVGEAVILDFEEE